MKIVNLTQHEATREQIEAGVFEPVEKELVKNSLLLRIYLLLMKLAIELNDLQISHSKMELTRQ